jgi:N-acetylglucosaminyldiphosphoundecaprenol N-acetyl-beta-D-mannosaminyltransferase
MKDEDLRETLSQADLVAVDAVAFAWLGRLLGSKAERISGSDLMPALLAASSGHGSHYFYGSDQEKLEAQVQEIRRRFPGLQVAGYCSLPYRSGSWREMEATAAMINAAAPDYVWVGLRSPEQDRWLAAFRPLLHASVLLGLGPVAFEQSAVVPAPA